MDVNSGKVLWTKNSALTGFQSHEDDRLRDGLVIANDGSALLASLHRHRGNFQRIQIITAHGTKVLRGPITACWNWPQGSLDLGRA